MSELAELKEQLNRIEKKLDNIDKHTNPANAVANLVEMNLENTVPQYLDTIRNVNRIIDISNKENIGTH